MFADYSHGRNLSFDWFCQACLAYAIYDQSDRHLHPLDGGYDFQPALSGLFLLEETLAVGVGYLLHQVTKFLKTNARHGESIDRLRRQTAYLLELKTKIMPSYIST